MASDLKIPINYAEAAEVLKTGLKMSGSPVAFRFVHKKEEIPEGMQKFEGNVRHCTMVDRARREGKIFYATSENHECNGGAWSLGLREITETLKTGDFYFKLGKFESSAACKRTIDRVAHLDTGYTYATLYAPLEKAPFVPQVIVIVASPWAMLKISQSTLFRLGGRIHAEFAGIQSVCADACAQTFMNGKVNFSLGCDGSRKFSGIADGEMVMGIPAEEVPDLVEALKVVTAAPGSKPGAK